MDNSNEAPSEAWAVPKCGVGRAWFLLPNEPATSSSTNSIADEITDHFNGPEEATTEIAAILSAVEPNYFMLEQIYRHAFHPECLVAIGEALICPPRTRAKQLADAFAPVVSKARRVERKPPKPRKRSINPETKDFAKFTHRVGWSLSWQIGDDWNGGLDAILAREKDYRPEHRSAIVAVAVQQARRALEMTENEVLRRRQCLARLERIAQQSEGS